MDSKDQRLYKVLKVGEHGHLFEGDRRVNTIVDTIGDLTKSILCDYLNISEDKFNVSYKQSANRISDMFYEKWREGNHLVNYGICGLSIKECINESTRPEVI